MGRHEDIRKLRLLPVNQIASMKLRQAELEEDLNMLPIFQLMGWGIINEKRNRYGNIETELSVLMAMDQVTALDCLFKNNPGGNKGLVAKLIPLTPAAAAKALLDVLDMRLKLYPENGFYGL